MTSRPARVLHVVDPQGPGGGPATLRVAAAAIARWPSAEHAVVVLGGSRERAVAERNALPVVAQLSLPLGSAALGRSRLARVICEGNGLSGVGAILAWSARAAVAAAGTCAASGSWGNAPRAGSRAAPLFAWLSVGATGSLESMLLRRAARCGRIMLLAAQDSVRDELCGIGVPPERVRTLAPGIEFSQGAVEGRDLPRDDASRAKRRAELRLRWDAEPEERMVGLFADPPSAADVRLSCYAVAIARVAERPMRIVMHPDVHAGDRWRRWSRRTGLGTALAVDASLDAPWSVADGLDFAIVLGERRRARVVEPGARSTKPDPIIGRGRRARPMIGTLPVSWLMACGVPVIAERTDALREVIVDGETGLLFKSQDHVRLAQLLTGLCDDPGASRRLADAAHDRVAVRCSAAEFAKSLERTIFARMTG